MMTTVGWIVFCAVCLILFCLAFLCVLRRNTETWVKIVAVVIAIGLGVGAYFGANHFFKAEEPVEEEVIEEVVEEIVEEEPNG